ncbi:MAG: alginate export family protein [Verrucomicrobiota bacterium]
MIKLPRRWQPLANMVAACTLAACQATAQMSATHATAAPAPSAPPAASAGLLNDWLRSQDSVFGPMDLGGQFRPRYVSQSYFAVPGGGPTAVDFRANSPHSENDFLLLRTRLHLGYAPADWLQFYGEGQNSSSTGDRRNPNPQSDGPADLHQGFVKLGGGSDVPLSVKVGRQELSYGDERLIGAFDWDNIGRAFDAAKLRYEQNGFWVDVFAGRVVLPDDDRFDAPNWRDWFSGLYASTRSVCPRTELQFYVLADNAGVRSPKAVTTAVKGNSPRDIYTVGARFQTLPGQLNGWDLNGEFAGQFGDFEYAPGTAGVVAGKRLDQLAYAAHLEGGYTFVQAQMKPRLALGLDHASGDNDPTDQDHHTFVNLYPTNHKFYGAMDLLAWQNLIDPYLKASIVPVKNLSLALTYNAFWLATTSDFFYQVNQAPRTAGGYGLHPGNGSFAGHEIDLVATCQIRPYFQVQGGYGHFFTGTYVDDTFAKMGGSHDADWGYVQAVFSF